MRPPEKSGKILALEAIRGMAAIGVVFHHFTLAYLPRLANYAPPAGVEGALVGTPLFLLINGKAMVTIFFVLSGYVLALKGTGPYPVRAIANSAIKRWFRFAPIILLSLLCSYVLFTLNLYHYGDVYALNGARMFDHFGGLTQTYKPPFAAVLYDGLIGSLLLGNNSMNVALWTMQIEFFGSMIVFLLALLLAPERRWWLWVALPVAACALLKGDVWYFPFLFGVLGVALRLGTVTLSGGAAAVVLALGLYFCGFFYPQQWYVWLAIVPLPEYTLRVFISSIGGFLLLIVFASQNPVSRRFNGTVSRMLGKTSFSLYLLHTLLLSSFSAWAYVRMGGSTAGVIAAAAMFPVAAIPLVGALTLFDVWWLRTLARWHPAGRSKA